MFNLQNGIQDKKEDKITVLEKEVAALRRALKSHGELIEKYAALVLEIQELKCKLELSQEL